MILTDSVFSMDGDVADLPGLCELADRYDALLIVDEAHATGVLGDTGAGLCELQGVADRVDVTVSTAGKALGSLGGFVTGKQIMIDWLINRARSFIFTTGAMPAQAGAIKAGLDLIRDEPERRQRLAGLAAWFSREIEYENVSGHPASPVVPIIPIIAGEAQAAIALSKQLEAKGFLAPAIRPPTVAPGAARVRICLRADMEERELTGLVDAIRTWQSNR